MGIEPTSEKKSNLRPTCVASDYRPVARPFRFVKLTNLGKFFKLPRLTLEAKFTCPPNMFALILFLGRERPQWSRNPKIRRPWRNHKIRLLVFGLLFIRPGDQPEHAHKNSFSPSKPVHPHKKTTFNTKNNIIQQIDSQYQQCDNIFNKLKKGEL